MDTYLDKRKEELKEEINASKELLKANMDNLKVKDYITLGGGALPGFLKGLIDNPSKTISGGDMITRSVLPSNNPVRKIFHYLSFIKRTIKLITK